MSTVRRRQLLFTAAAFLAARFARAQSKISHRVGFLTLSEISRTDPGYIAWRELEDALGRLGYREGVNLVIERRHANGDASRLKEATLELAKAGVEVIVAFGSRHVRGALEASHQIPIVSYTADPVGLGFAQGYARPGGNVTGVSPSTSDLSPKQLELLTATVPRLRKVAWLRNPGNPYFSRAFADGMGEAAAKLGVTVAPFDVATADALEPTVVEIARKGFGGVLVPSDVLYVRFRERLAKSLLAHRLPSVTLDAVMLEAGLLLSYGINFVDGIGRMAVQIDKILKGAIPGEIPIDIIERFTLGVNLKTAKALGLAIPKSILLRADRVIE